MEIKIQPTIMDQLRYILVDFNYNEQKRAFFVSTKKTHKLCSEWG